VDDGRAGAEGALGEQSGAGLAADLNPRTGTGSRFVRFSVV
jgi:hypothetical protein